MPGLKLLTKSDARMCLKVAWRTAQDLGFALTPIDDASKRFTATKGNVVMKFLAGAALAPYCKFEIAVESYSDANELILERNKPWLTGGTIGIARVNRQAEELMNAIAGAIEKNGGTILERKEY